MAYFICTILHDHYQSLFVFIAFKDRTTCEKSKTVFCHSGERRNPVTLGS